MRYMIHACPPRMWYVENLLLPSMLEQGISRDDITVWNDAKGLGNLESFVQSMKLCGALTSSVGSADSKLGMSHASRASECFPRGEADDRGVWHLQDDVILSASFAERTKELAETREEPVICGFGCNFGDGVIDYKGRTPVKFLWYSFPCVFISNALAGEFAAWFENVARTGELYRDNLQSGKMDDWFFRMFLLDRHKDEHVFHVTPALADHVDYLIGGTQVNPRRLRKYNVAEYWEEPELVDRLKAKINVYKRTGRWE